MSIEGTATPAPESPAPAVSAADVFASEISAPALEVPVEVAAEAPLEAPKVEVAPVEDKFAVKFAALSRKEKQQREREKAYTAKEAALEQRIKDLEAQYGAKQAEVSSKYINPEDFKRDPLAVLEAQGFTFEQLAQRVLNGGKAGQEEAMSDVERKMVARYEALEKKLAEKETAETAREAELKQKNYEQTVQGFQAQLTDFVNKEADYELIRANDAVGLVYEVIEEHHKKTFNPKTGEGLILSNKEAADAVEKYLLDEAKKQISLNKVKSLLAPQQAKPEVKPASIGSLSNAHSTQATSTVKKFLSDEDSKRQASKLIVWE